MDKPLDGKRIVVTRAAEQAQETADLLRSYGARPIVLPMIQFVLLDTAQELLERALNQIEKYDWIIFTSQNGVRFFFESCQQAPRIWRDSWQLGASGEKTAELLRGYGFEADVVPEKFVGESLVEALGDVAGQRILLPRAKKGRPEIVTMLQARGAIVDEIALYDTISADPTPEALAELDNGFDAILFTSPTTVKNYIAKVANSPAGTVGNFVVACIGEVTRRAAEAHNLTVNITPEESTMDGLITALIEYYNNE